MNVLNRLPFLVCPRCHGDLEESAHALICGGCGRRYPVDGAVPNMLTEDLAEFAQEIEVQNRVSEEYERKRYSDELAARYHDWWALHMIHATDLQEPILDNGCGVGFLLDRLKSDRMVGLDISGDMAKKASVRHDRIVVGNSQELPFKDDSFGTVFCRGLLHHLPAPEAGASEMYRVLRPGGRIVVVDPNESILTSLPRILAYRGGHFSDGHKNFNRKYLRSILEKHFRIDAVNFFGYVAYPIFGFPDILPISRYLPFKHAAYSLSMRLDGALSKAPALRVLGWAVMVTASK